MKRILLPFFVLFAISSVARSAETPALIDRPAAGAGPTQVSVGIWIVDITNIDSAQQNFTADLAIVFRWKDARLAHTGTGVAYYALDQVWTPRVGIANETSSVVRKLPESAEAEPDGTVLYRQRYVGSFTQPLRLQSFPFGRQAFRIQFVAIRYQPNEVAFVADENWIRDGLQQAAGISRSITLPDWTVEKWDAKASIYALTLTCLETDLIRRSNKQIERNIMAKTDKSTDSVYRVTEVIGTSTQSWEDAAKTAVQTAAGTLRDLRIAEVVKMDVKIEDGKVLEFRTRLQLSFKYES